MRLISKNEDDKDAKTSTIDIKVLDHSPNYRTRQSVAKNSH